MPANLISVAATAPAAMVVDTLNEHGAVVVHDLLDAGVLGRLNGEIGPYLEQQSPSGRGFVNETIAAFFGERTRHLTGVAGKSRTLATEVITHPLLRAVCDAVLLPSCAAYQVNLAHVLDRGPGAERQWLHRDEDVWPHLPRPHAEVQLATMIALVDFDTERGGTLLAPGSHRWERGRQPTEDELAVAEMPAGSAVIYLGSTIHAAGANTTSDVWRRGMHLSYCAGWLRTEENHYLATPPEVVRELPLESLALLGFAAHDAIAAGGGYLGTVDLQDPIELMRRERAVAS